MTYKLNDVSAIFVYFRILILLYSFAIQGISVLPHYNPFSPRGQGFKKIEMWKLILFSYMLIYIV